MNFDNCKLEGASDVISGVVIDLTGVEVRVKLGDSRSNSSRDMRLPHFVTDDERTTNDTGVRRSSHKAKRQYGVSHKNQLVCAIIMRGLNFQFKFEKELAMLALASDLDLKFKVKY